MARSSVSWTSAIAVVLVAAGAVAAIVWWRMRSGAEEEDRGTLGVRITTTESPAEGGVEDVTADELDRAYLDNEVAAQRRFVKKPLRVTGVVRGVTRVAGDVYVVLSSHPHGVACHFPTKTDERVILPLKRGERTVLFGYGAGIVDGAPVIDACRVVSP
jgi:hypothetical protein